MTSQDRLAADSRRIAESEAELAAATEELRRRHARPLQGQSLADAIRAALENADSHIAAAVERANVLDSLIIGAHDKAFADRNYEYVYPQTAIDLLIADLKTARIERAAAVERAEKAEGAAVELAKKVGVERILADMTHRAEAAEDTVAGLREALNGIRQQMDLSRWQRDCDHTRSSCEEIKCNGEQFQAVEDIVASALAVTPPPGPRDEQPEPYLPHGEAGVVLDRLWKHEITPRKAHELLIAPRDEAIDFLNAAIQAAREGR